MICCEFAVAEQRTSEFFGYFWMIDCVACFHQQHCEFFGPYGVMYVSSWGTPRPGGGRPGRSENNVVT